MQAHVICESRKNGKGNAGVAMYGHNSRGYSGGRCLIAGVEESGLAGLGLDVVVADLVPQTAKNNRAE